MSKLPEPLEHAIQTEILEYLGRQYPQHYFWRNNSGALPDKRGIPVRFGLVGSADILGITPSGQFVALEVKRPSTRSHTTPAQDTFLLEISTRGGIAGVVASTQDVDALLKAPTKFRDTDKETPFETPKSVVTRGRNLYD